MSFAGFERCLAFAWRPENDGQERHKTAGDNGGWTRRGVTYANFLAWRRSHMKPAPTLTDFDLAAARELEDLIYAWTWKPCGGDDLPVGVDLMVFEAAFGSGAANAVRILQRALKMPVVDGRFGPATRQAALAMPRAELVKAFRNERLAWLYHAADWPLFGDGWRRRLDRDQAEALAWITGAPAPVVSSDLVG